MTWPTAPMPTTARALLVFPSGHRALDEDLVVAYPLPESLDVTGDPMAGVYHLVHVHHPGQIDGATRALYVLGGHYLPHGAAHVERLAPEEAFDQ